mgnify:CR=1 FL=1
MSAVADQAYLNTRVSMMATRLFAPGFMKTLAGRSLSELGEQFGLVGILEDTIPTRSKSRAVGHALIQTLLTELTILVRPMAPAERSLVLLWGRKFALFNLKALIRGKLYNLDASEIQENLYPLPANLRLPQKTLFRTENVLELLRQLEAGPYSLIARQAREVYEQKREPFALEGTIDQRYLAALAKQTREFYGVQHRELHRVVGVYLDQINLLWLLRFRFAYRLSPSETFYQLVPSLSLLHRDRLLELVNLDSIDKVLAALPEPLDGLLAGSVNLVDLQQRMAAYAATEAARVLRHGASGVARALAYLMLREMDLQRLFALTHGRMLKLPEELVAVAVDLAASPCPMPFQ